MCLEFARKVPRAVSWPRRAADRRRAAWGCGVCGIKGMEWRLLPDRVPRVVAQLQAVDNACVPLVPVHPRHLFLQGTYRLSFSWRDGEDGPGLTLADLRVCIQRRAQLSAAAVSAERLPCSCSPLFPPSAIESWRGQPCCPGADTWPAQEKGPVCRGPRFSYRKLTTKLRFLSLFCWGVGGEAFSVWYLGEVPASQPVSRRGHGVHL